MRQAGTWDADGIMIRAAAMLGQYHREQGWKPYLKWNTAARTQAYHTAYNAAQPVRKARAAIAKVKGEK